MSSWRFDDGVPFSRQGTFLYLADRILPDFFSGPPLPKNREEDSQQKREPVKTEAHPGSFVLDMERSHALQRQKIKRKGVKKEVPWKKDARRLRRERGRQ